MEKRKASERKGKKEEDIEQATTEGLKGRRNNARTKNEKVHGGRKKII